jgi:hypothetical protein
MKQLLQSLQACRRAWLTRLCFVVGLLGSSGLAYGQSSANYTFSTNTTGSLALDMNSNAVDMSTGTTQLVGAGLDATASVLTNFSFDFFFMGNRFTQFSVQEDGIVQLGGVVVSTNIYTINGGTVASPRLSAFNADFRTGTTTGKIHSKVVGSAPNRCLVIEFKEMQLFYTGTANAGTSTWQMRFYETSGVIEYVYGAMNVTSTTAGNKSPSIGFYQGNTSTNFASVAYATHTNSTTAPYTANPAVTATGNITNLHSTADGSRRFYRYAPPASLASPTSLNFTSVSLTSMTLNWTASSPTTGIQKYAIYSSTDNVTFSYVSAVNIGTNTYTATGLMANTLYYWRVFPLSEGALGTALTGSQSTLACGTYSGTMTVGATGTFPTLTNAITTLTACGYTGDIILELQTTYTSVSETFPLTFGTGLGASSSKTITIRPTTGATGLSISSANTTATIDLNGASYVIFDGRAGGVGVSQLTIANTSTATGGTAVRFINEASNNTLRYVTLSALFASTTSGVVNFSTTTGANGNDNNTIEFSNIDGGAGATASPTATASQGIYSAGTTTSSTHNNSGNIVSNCNIFNVFTAGTASNGILIGTGNTDWTISGNSIYQTAIRTSTVGVTHTGININTTAGNNFVVTGNFIGGDGANAVATTNKYTITSANGNLFQGIAVSVGTTTVSSIQNNTIANVSIQSTNTSAVFNGIVISNGNVNVGNTTGNTVGSTSVSSTSIASASIAALQSTNNGGIVHGINNSSAGTVNISNNTISGFYLAAQSGPNTLGHIFYGIRSTAGTNTINANNIGSASSANNINSVGSQNTTTNANSLFGISVSNANTNSITNNNIRNMGYTATGGTGPSTGVAVNGISAVSTGTYTITGNNINNLTNVSGNNGTAASASMIGVLVTSTGGNHNVGQNTIFNLSNTHGTVATVVTGIQFTGSTTNVVERNFIYNLTSSTTSTSAEINGIRIAGGTTTYRNNMIALGAGVNNAIGTGSTAGISGIFEFLGTNNIWHNSIYIGGTPTAGIGASYAFNGQQTTNTRSFRNNIFVNNRSNSGATGKNYIVRVGGSGTPPITGLTINNNAYFANGTGAVFGFFNSADVASLVAWQTAVGQDVNSVNANPNYINPTASTPDLHINTTLTRIFWFNLRKVQFFGNRVHLQKQQSVFYLKSYSQSTPLLN